MKAAIGVLLIVGVAWALDRWSLGVALDAYLFSYGFWLQAAMIGLVALALIAMTARPWFSAWVITSLLLVLYVANHLKLRYLASPLTAADYFLVRDLDANGVGLFARYLSAGWAVLGVAAFLAVCVCLLRWETPLARRSFGLRAGVFASAVALLLMGTSGAQGERTFDMSRLGILVYSPILNQLRAGLLSHLAYSVHSMAGAFDEPVDRGAVRKLMTGLGTRPSLSLDSVQGPAPDIVIIQSESFFNPDLIEQVGDTRALLPNLHRAMDAGEGGAMIVPTFGGGTIRTEFEVLTGVPLAAYAKVQYPYLQLGNHKVPSLAQTFSGAGYETVAVHGNSGSFWNRNRAMSVLGFGSFLTAGQFGAEARHDGGYLSDSAMTDEIMAKLAQPGRPRFIFAISIEAHGPYSGVPVADESARERIARPPSFSTESAEEYSRYAYHIAHADHEFGRLWDYLEKRGRPYVLVFYGDHLPAFRYIYHEATFRNGRGARAQEVPWVVVGSGVRSAARQDIYAWMLPGQVLGLSGVKPSPYLALTERAGRSLLDDETDSDGRRAGLYSAARLDVQGQFDLFSTAMDLDDL